jgi:nucleoside-diphosphate-sugar epimerase
MRYMVTGADGFIASHLCDELIKRGHQVVAFCRYHSRQELRNIHERQGLEVVWGDCTSLDTLRQVTGRLDGVFHLGAAIDVAWSIELGGAGYYELNNRLGSQLVRKFAYIRGGCRVLLMSSSEVYGTPEKAPITEKHPINPQSPYAASKAGMERDAECAGAGWSDYVIARPFNTFGPRQTKRGVISKICECRANCIEPAIPKLKLGRTDTIRDWVYVSDTVDGLIRIMEHGRQRAVYNLGTGRKTAVAEACQIAKVMPETSTGIDRGASEVLLLQADSSKAEAELGWRPEVTLEDGIARTIEWWRLELEARQ